MAAQPGNCTRVEWPSAIARCIERRSRNLTDAYYVSRLRADIPAGFETWGRTYILTVNAKL